MSELKRDIYEAGLNQLNQRQLRLLKELDALKESAEADTKSSMGDKYETGREMINLEKGKITEQLTQVKQMLELLKSIDPEKLTSKAELGAIVKTNLGQYFISVGLGVLEAENDKVFAISPGSPIGQQMLNKKKGDDFQMAGRTQTILEIQ